MVFIPLLFALDSPQELKVLQHGFGGISAFALAANCEQHSQQHTLHQLGWSHLGPPESDHKGHFCRIVQHVMIEKKTTMNIAL